jgi:hypothetical protein
MREEIAREEKNPSHSGISEYTSQSVRQCSAVQQSHRR